MRHHQQLISNYFLPCLLFAAFAPISMVAQKDTASALSSNMPSVPQRVEPHSIESAPVEQGDYVLGTGDRLTIRVFGADDFPDRPIEVGADGNINAPMLGKIHASGVPLHRLQDDLTGLYGKYFKSPEVFLFVTDYRSQPVTVVGAVNLPGVVQLRRPTRLMEAISQAGGLRPDAGDKALISRHIDNPAEPGAAGAPTSPDSNFVSREVDLRKIIEGTDPSLNIVVRANDLISIPKAKMVYVVGDVGRPGGYILDGHASSLTVLQAIALAGGVNRTAKAKDTRILRASGPDGTHRTERSLDLRMILAAKSPDISLEANDILFVPNSAAKSAGLKSVQMALDITTGLAIWRF